MIDFSDLALSPNESRAARNFLGLSQAQVADQSTLQAHKLKRFEAGNYVPDSQFLGDLRDFYEAQGYDFRDDQSPGAKARAKGDVFPAGVVGAVDSSTEETASSPSGKPAPVARPQTANLQYMRIAPTLQPDQVDRAFDSIEENEAAFAAGLATPVSRGFLSDAPGATSQAQAIALLRSLAENGLTYARLMGRELLPAVDFTPAPKGGPASTMLADSGRAQATIGDLLRQAFGDLYLAVVQGDKEAAARRKARVLPTEVMQALLG